MRASAGAPARAPAPSVRPGKLEWTLSVLNAVVGDYLQRRGNDLHIEMGLYRRNAPLACERGAIARAHPRTTGKVCVLVHGLALNEGVWSFPRRRGVSYGSLLARDLGYTPFYVRYNTGLHISENGRALATLLRALVRSLPVEVRELVLIGHSMGGLVVRSACELARACRDDWLERPVRAFYLGSPHLGVPLEKLGNVVARVLSGIGVAHTTLVADVINARSAGIKDLRHPNLTERDWRGVDPDAPLRGRRPLLSLVPGVSHHFVAGAVGAREADVFSLLLGDGIVPARSASYLLAPGERPLGELQVFPGVGHMALAHHRGVYDWIRARCAGEAGAEVER